MDSEVHLAGFFRLLLPKQDEGTSIPNLSPRPLGLPCILTNFSPRPAVFRYLARQLKTERRHVEAWFWEKKDTFDDLPSYDKPVKKLREDPIQ